jgi:spermidine synthase
MSAEPQPFPRKILLFITAFFFLSGMCGLIYQVVWTRALSLIFGHTTFAISTVITAFMGGLALGSHVLGKWADREGGAIAALGGSRQFVMYGILELCVGLYCLATPALFAVVESVYLRFSDLPFHGMSVLRFFLCCLVLIFPTFCMGGTLPLMTKFLTRRSSELGARLSSLYFINTLGAVAGTFLAGFYLIRTAGLGATLQCAAVINIGIGLLVYVLNRNLGSIDITTPADEGASPLPGDLRLIVSLFALTGFASMMYEICWTRSLALSLGSSTYAFSAMLTTFLLGIALGSLLYRRYAGTHRFTARDFGLLEIGISIACLLTVPLLGKLPAVFVSLFPFVKKSYDLVLALDFLLSALTMLVPTTLMGFVFPLVGNLAARRIADLGRSVGNIYAVNTAGCILGSFLTGFFIIPLAGIQETLRLAVLLNFIAGIAVLRKDLLRPLHLGAAAAFVLLVISMPRWNTAVMNSGVAIYAERMGTTGLQTAASGERPIFHRDGITTTVSVFSFGENRITLRLNGKADASTAAEDMPTQLLLGYIPALYHPAPRDVFVIGLGSGITAKAVLDFPEVRSAVCAELEPAVVEANRYFTPYNGNVLHNPRMRVVLDDGRNALLAGRSRYDLIISEPSNPWIAGIASLYTREFYGSSLQNLREGGIFCQWLQIYNIQPRDIRMIFKTFFSVFPEGAVWIGSHGDLLLLGSAKPLTLDWGRLEKMYAHPPFRKAMSEIGLGAPDALFGHYITDAETLSPLFIPAVYNTDDLPILEFSAPMSIYASTFLENLKGLLSCKSGFLPSVRGFPKGKGLSKEFYIHLADYYGKLHNGYARKVIDEARKLYPKDSEIAVIAADLSLSENRLLVAERDLRAFVARNPRDPAGYVHLARLVQEQGLAREADRIFETAYRLFPTNLAAAKGHAAGLAREGNHGAAWKVISPFVPRFAKDADLQLLAGTILARMGRADEAVGMLRRSLHNGADPSLARREIFATYKKAGDVHNAIVTGLQLHDAQPADTTVIIETAALLAGRGDKALASDLLFRGLAADPYNRTIIMMLKSLGALNVL